jgi:hypothetical protein
MTLLVGSVEYNGLAQNLTATYREYRESWFANPSDGTTWTWSDVADLEAGVRMRGQNSNFPAYCTQVWIEVEYRN